MGRHGVCDPGGVSYLSVLAAELGLSSSKGTVLGGSEGVPRLVMGESALGFNRCLLIRSTAGCGDRGFLLSSGDLRWLVGGVDRLLLDGVIWILVGSV